MNSTTSRIGFLGWPNDMHPPPDTCQSFETAEPLVTVRLWATEKMRRALCLP